MTDSVDKLVYERALLVPRGMDGASARKALQAVHKTLSPVAPDTFNAGNLSQILHAHMQASQVNPDALLSVLRVAITGSKEPLDIYEAMERLGKERAMRRLEHAIQELI